MPIILDGKAVAAEIKADVAEKVKRLRRPPCLAVILAGDNPASKVYVRNKKRDCEECGILCEDHILPENVTQYELLELIAQLNKQHDVDGILVQLPLPRGLNTPGAKYTILQAIAADKDVDGFTAVNMGRLMLGSQVFVPCTAEGVLWLLQEYRVPIKGKHCVIVGRSDIVGKPLAQLMLQEDATVTVCHSVTEDLRKHTRSADILISAAGVRGLITGDMVTRGTVVVDVGINRDEHGKLCGDVCFDEAAQKASYITPVPGGVGPMTRAILMTNVLRAARRRQT